MRPGRLAVAFTLASILMLSGCKAPADEAALRARIDAMQSAVEARDAEALLDPVDEAFGGPQGMDRDGLRRYAALMFLRQRRVGVVLGPVEVEVRGDRAAARFDALVTGAEGLLPGSAEARHVDTVWRLEDGEWVLVSADWSKPAMAR